MRAPLSIVIPTLNAAGSLPTCLAALMEGLHCGIIRELIVVDGGSTDATLQIAEAAGAIIKTTAPSRGGQLRAGAAEATGSKGTKGAWLLFLHADTVLHAGWSTAVEQHLQHTTPQKAGYFRLRFDAKGLAPWAVAGWANLRSHWLSLPYGDQGLLISQDHYDAVGGFADIPLMEDVAMAKALRGSLVGLDGVALTSAYRYQKTGWLRRGTRNIWTLLRYTAGVSPHQLAKQYRDAPNGAPPPDLKA